MAEFDYLVVGAGLFGAVFAREAADAGKRVLVIDQRAHLAGNIYTEDRDGIPVHCYGAHIFHTSDEEVWRYVNRFAAFNRFTNAPLARYQGKLYHLPFNMNTFYALWGTATPQEARAKIEAQRGESAGEPRNLEEQAIALVGRDVYETLIQGYTEKQWGRPCRELPASIIRRLPVRLTWDNNYFNDAYQGVPRGGYTGMVARMLEGIETRLNTAYTPELRSLADRMLYTGSIDGYFGYSLGHLEYRSLRFETERMEVPDYQGNAVINDTNAETPYTRTIEHKHFAYDDPQVMASPCTWVTREYPLAWKEGEEPYYTVNDEKNAELYARYQALAGEDSKVIFGGRLGLYKYLDMDDTIRAALDLAARELGRG
ncbi:MAG: UDP-galactopyranose mutase [Clostridia bacterium]|nr:UDP-galactopyranose mutase [Clostridia bacterium]